MLLGRERQRQVVADGRASGRRAVGGLEMLEEVLVQLMKLLDV